MTDPNGPSTPPDPASPPAEAKPVAAPAAAGANAAPPAAPKPAVKAEPKAPPPPPGPPDPPPPADLPRPAWLQAIDLAMPGTVVPSYWVGDWTIIVPRERIIDVLTWLRDAPEARFDFCSDVTAVDWPARESARFDVVYALYSILHRHRVRVKVRVADGQDVPTAVGVWPAANWLEREIFDMFGVTFAGHPDLRRILMPDEWQGHPQRKDYPLEGPGELLLEGPEHWLAMRNDVREAGY